MSLLDTLLLLLMSRPAPAPAPSGPVKPVLYYFCEEPQLKVWDPQPRSHCILKSYRRRLKAELGRKDVTVEKWGGQALGPTDGVLLVFIVLASERASETEFRGWLAKFPNVNCDKFMVVCQFGMNDQGADKLVGGKSFDAMKKEGLLSGQYCMDFGTEEGIVPPSVSTCTTRTKKYFEQSAAAIRESLAATSS